MSDRVAEPEPAFLAGAGAEKITKFLLRLLVNCKAENYEFLTTKKKIIFFPDTKLQNLHVRLLEHQGTEDVFFKLRAPVRLKNLEGGEQPFHGDLSTGGIATASAATSLRLSGYF